MKLSGKIQFLLLFFLVLVIVVLVGFNFFLSGGEVPEQLSFLKSPSRRVVSWFKATRFNPEYESEGQGEKTDLSFAAPVEKEHFKEVKLTQLDLGMNDLGFKLPPGSPFYAGFDGEVQISGKYPQQVINLYASDGRRLLYLFCGLTEISGTKNVTKGEILGKASANNLPTRDFNLIVQYYQSGERITFTENLIEEIVE